MTSATAAVRARAGAGSRAIALADDSGTRTWTQLAHDLERAAGALLAVAPGPSQRVSVIGENAIPTLVAHAAALAADADAEAAALTELAP